MSLLPVRQAVAPGYLPRHRHDDGYLAVVLSGGYEEAGDIGRRRVAAGDVIIHQAWEAHLNRTAGWGAQVMNLPLPQGPAPPFGRIIDLDRVARIAERDPVEAAASVIAELAPAPCSRADWPDLLGEALRDGDSHSLRTWAARFGISPEHLSRGFGQVFGVTPQAFRRDARNRAALRDLVDTDTPLADLAAAHGYADQAHMTRSLRAFTGRTPGAWRTSIAFKTPA